MKLKLTFLFGFLFLLSTCKKEPDEAPVPTPMDCSNITEFRNLLDEEIDKNNFIKEVRPEGDQYLFIFEDNQTQAFPKECFELVEPNEEDWVVNIVYSDSTNHQPRYLGKLGINCNVNPNGTVPLHAKLQVFVPIKGKVAFKVRGKNGASSDIARSFDDFSTAHQFNVLGLYPNHDNVIDIIYLDENGKERTSDTIHIQTEAYPYELPIIEVDIRKEDRMKPGMTFVSYRGLVYNPNVPFMMDQFGDIRWYLDFTDHPQLRNLGYDVGVERLANGNFYFGDWSTSAIYEVDVFGKVINSWGFPGYSFHHNVIEKPDGNFLVTVNKEGSLHQNGGMTVEDHIIEIDRETGDIIQEWDLRESLDENRIALANALEDDYIDWIHVNAIVYDETDNTIILSGRTQGVVKLDYGNNVVWILGPHEGWGENRRGDDLNSFLLTPLDANGAIITNENILLGFENHPDFEWNWYQHAPHFMPNGNLMLFDNGDRRNFTGEASYSRAVEYIIDEDAMTVKQIWQYGKERGLSTYASIVSDVDYHEAENTVLFAPGAFVDNGNFLYGGKVIEVDYQSKEVVFEARLSSQGITFHRVERMPLYSN